MNVCKSRVEKGLYWDEAWSLVSGCTPISEGCQNCWSARETHMRAEHPNEKIKARNKGLTEAGRLSTRFNGRIRLRWSERSFIFCDYLKTEIYMEPPIPKPDEDFVISMPEKCPMRYPTGQINIIDLMQERK